jgi:hypothetical protein
MGWFAATLLLSFKPLTFMGLFIFHPALDRYGQGSKIKGMVVGGGL